MELKDYLKAHKKTHLIFDLDETLLELILPWELWEKDVEDNLRNIDPNIIKDHQERKLHLSLMENAYVSKYPSNS